MNKLRLIRIFELRGKVHPIEQYVIDLLDGIEKVVPHQDRIDYKKDGIFYFSYYINSKNLDSYYMYARIFKENFKSSYKELCEIMKYLLEKHLKLEINEVR